MPYLPEQNIIILYLTVLSNIPYIMRQINNEIIKNYENAQKNIVAIV